MDLERLARVAIVGTSCSGKTTLARSLSLILDAPHTELDVLHWGPNWTARPLDEFRARVQEAVASPRWVLDGNYSCVRDLVWARATTLVWLNYPFRLVFSRALLRTVTRIITREPLFADNRESLRGIADPDWIPWWVLRTFWRRRREYPVLLSSADLAHVQVLEFTRRSEADALLRQCLGRRGVDRIGELPNARR